MSHPLHAEWRWLVAACWWRLRRGGLDVALLADLAESDRALQAHDARRRYARQRRARG